MVSFMSVLVYAEMYLCVLLRERNTDAERGS